MKSDLKYINSLRLTEKFIFLFYICLYILEIVYVVTICS